jgi:hypothetical protein
MKWLLAVGSVAALAIPIVAAEPPQKLNLSTRALVAAASKYVVDYETKFKFVIADENYRQTTYDRKRVQTATRNMKGELFLTFIPADGVWLAVHDFAEVDGVPVTDRDDLRALLQKGETSTVARTVLYRNSRFNLGRIGRNFNEPTLALLILEPKRVNGFAFDRQEVVTKDDRTTVRLSFRERDRPTLVQSPRGPVYSKGEIVVDAATGRIEQSVIEFSNDQYHARLSTTYALDEKVEMWVPVAFGERYEKTGDDGELILCQADYSNYRKFDVTARIK